MESQYYLIPCLYLGKNFNHEFQHHTLSQAQIVFKNSIKHKLGNVSYEVKYDQKLISSQQDYIRDQVYKYFFKC